MSSPSHLKGKSAEVTAVLSALDSLKLVHPELTEWRERARGELTAQLPTDEAPQAEAVIQAEETAEATENPLAKLKADFDRGIRLIKADRTVSAKPAELTWEEVLARLAEKNTVNPDKTNLEMISAMQGGGEMIGVDENGKLLFKDRGNEPVMFGSNQKGERVMVYDRKLEEMAKVSSWADYYEIYEAVYGAEGKPTGYELFPDAPDYDKQGAIAAVEAVTEVPFVKSANGTEWRSSWLDNGRNPPRNAGARCVGFYPRYQKTRVVRDNPNGERAYRGAVRLLRV